MNTKALAISFAILLCVPTIVSATAFPEAVDVGPSPFTVNATASLEYGPIPYAYPAIEGAGSLNLECLSASGDADVKVEVKPASSINVDTPIDCISEGVSVSEIIASTLSDLGAEGEWMFALPLCAAEFTFVIITGVNSNPADTLCKAKLIFK